MRHRGTFLTVADVQDVIARAVAEAQARNAPATIAVVDRVGNVLGVFADERRADDVHRAARGRHAWTAGSKA